MNRARKRNVFIITGFLGSGKTTLLRRALSHIALDHTAVLVNEFGKVGLDHHLLRQIDEKTVLVGGGCLCCSVRDDLVKALRDILDEDHRGNIDPIERVIVETSGLADPAPILFTILTDSVLQHHFQSVGVIVTVDAVNGPLHLDRQPESEKQVAVADKIVITKTDLADSGQVEALIQRIRTINPSAEIIESVLGEVDIEHLFESIESSDLSLSMARSGNEARGHHIPTTRSISLTFDKPLDWNAFGLWLSMLLHARGEDVLRVKGLIDVGDDGPVVLNGVQHIIHPPQHLDEWPSDDQRSHIVFIVKNMDPNQILDSLGAFQHILGAQASVRDWMDVLF